MNLRSVDLNLIPIFDAIFTEGNLTRAAERMAMSQPAMSNALARLRRQARDPLFLRTAKGMVPTPRAQRMAADFRQALVLIRNGLQPQDFDFSASQRDFSIAVEDYGEAVITPPFMDWLLKTAPRVQARIWPGRSQTIQDELRNGTVDLAVDYFKLEGRGLQSALLMTD
ncbi:MAG: LysR family transcriptional regulator, partial [Burkholderiaceae bacterium]